MVRRADEPDDTPEETAPASGPGDPCPQCGTPLGPMPKPRVRPKGERGKPYGGTEAIARCQGCGYELSPPKLDKR